MLTSIEIHRVEGPVRRFIRDGVWTSLPVGHPDEPEDGYVSDLDAAVRKQGMVDVYFCSEVHWEPDGHMITGPVVYARLIDGRLVRATHYIALAAGCFVPADDSELVVDEDARRRMADHFRSLYATHPEHQEPGGVDATVSRALQLFA